MSLFSPSETWKERSLAICRWSAIATAIATPMSTAVSSIMTGIMMVAWLASGEVVRTVKVAAKQPAGKMLLIFMAWLVVGTLYAATPWIDRLITLISWKKLAITFILLGLFCDAYWKERFVKGYLVIMIVGLAISLFLWLMGMDFSPRRPAGIFMNNYATQSMAFLVAFIFCLFLWPNQESMKNKVLLAIVLVLFAFDILFVSVARSGYVAFFTALAFALCYLLGKKKIPYIIGFLVVVLGIVALTSANFRYRVERGLQERANYLQDERETQVGLRVVFYKNTVALITQRPIFGYGTSSFKSVYAPYAAQKYTGWRGGATADPHNQYLFVWLENGLIGLVLFLAYIVTALRQGVKHPPYGVMAASFLIAICASSLFNSHFKTFEEGTLLAFVTGILIACPEYLKKTAERNHT